MGANAGMVKLMPTERLPSTLSLYGATMLNAAPV
jgi:hypothetical protein